jgi:hypothetical protein
MTELQPVPRVCSCDEDDDEQEEEEENNIKMIMQAIDV